MSLVLDMFQTVLGGEVEDITAYLLLVVRGAGIGGDALGKLPDGGRLCARNASRRQPEIVL